MGDHVFRGVPMALGWLAALGSVGLWTAHRAYARDSALLVALALALLLASMGGYFFILLWQNGFLTRDAMLHIIGAL